MDKTIKFERIFFSLETFLESLEDVHVNIVARSKFSSFDFMTDPMYFLMYNIHIELF